MTVRHCKVIILDEVNVWFHGLSKDTLTSLYDRHGAPAKGYAFHPLYKLGRWDGKIRFFHETGKTYMFLLEDVLQYVINRGYTIEIDDRRVDTAGEPPSLIDEKIFSHVKHAITDEPTILRDYQVAGVNNLLKSGGGILIAATGAGKTLITTALVTAYHQVGHRSITIVPDGTLVLQTKQDYARYGLEVGEYSGTRKELHKRHVVSTWQSLAIDPSILRSFTVIIVDECHKATGKMLNKTLIEHGAHAPYRFGVTGSLPKDKADALSVHCALGPVRYTINADELIDRGVLSKLLIHVLSLEEDLHAQYDEYLKTCNATQPITYSEFKKDYSIDYTAEKKYLQRNNQRLEWIANAIQSLKSTGTNSNTLIFVDSIQTGRVLQEMMPGSHFINGQDTKKISDRQEIFKLFDEMDDVTVIATVNIAGTGTNIPRVFNVFMIDIGKSFIRVIQAIGRGIRTAADKDFVNIYDIASDLKYGKLHSAARVKFYKEARYPHTLRKVKYTTAS